MLFLLVFWGGSVLTATCSIRSSITSTASSCDEHERARLRPVHLVRRFFGSLRAASARRGRPSRWCATRSRRPSSACGSGSGAADRAESVAVGAPARRRARGHGPRRRPALASRPRSLHDVGQAGVGLRHRRSGGRDGGRGRGRRRAGARRVDAARPARAGSGATSTTTSSAPSGCARPGARPEAVGLGRPRTTGPSAGPRTGIPPEICRAPGRRRRRTRVRRAELGRRMTRRYTDVRAADRTSVLRASSTSSRTPVTRPTDAPPVGREPACGRRRAGRHVAGAGAAAGAAPVRSVLSCLLVARARAGSAGRTRRPGGVSARDQRLDRPRPRRRRQREHRPRSRPDRARTSTGCTPDQGQYPRHVASRDPGRSERRHRGRRRTSTGAARRPS